MRSPSPRAAVALAAPAGVLAGHALGYLPGDPQAVDHSYLGVAAAVGPVVLAHGGTGGAIAEGAFLLFPVVAFFVLSRWSKRREQAEPDPPPEPEPPAGATP